MQLRSSEIEHNWEKNFMTKLLTTEEFAAAVGWKPATVRQKVYRREVEFVRMGRSIRFKPETVQKLIDRGTVPALEAR